MAPEIPDAGDRTSYRRQLSRFTHGHGGFTSDADLVDNVVTAADTSDGPTTDEVVAALGMIPAVYAGVRADERRLIELAIDGGMTWESLGAVYGGRSRQAMQQAYRRAGGTRSWPTTKKTEASKGRMTHEQ